MTDTIAAIATGHGRSAIGIIRLSGDSAITYAEQVFVPKVSGKLSEKSERKLIYGTLYDGNGVPIDDALATISYAPNSYTGENTAELQCHGSPTVLGAVMEALIKLGARQALGGEFTKRAFLNGKMDLTQSEAVVDLIDAETKETARHAFGQLSGAMRRKIDGVYSDLLDIMSHFHAVIDYPDEEIDPFEENDVIAKIKSSAAVLESLLKTYDRGKLLTNGVSCAIVGRPNVGKSSLLNYLVGYDRAIVTDIPGTTRDTISERIVIGDTLIRLIDTAGIHESKDDVERLGIERSSETLKQANIALVLVDGSSTLTAEDNSIIELATASCPNTIIAITKKDLEQSICSGDLSLPWECPTVTISSKTGDGISELESLIRDCIPADDGIVYGEMITNSRQAEAAGRATKNLNSALMAAESGFTPDAALTDVEEALQALGEMTGTAIREDITARIFERFCVGK